MDQQNFDLFTKKQEKEPNPKQESARQKRYDAAAALFDKKPDAVPMGDDYKLKCCKCNAVKRVPFQLHFAYGDHRKSFQCKIVKAKCQILKRNRPKAGAVEQPVEEIDVQFDGLFEGDDDEM